MALPTTTTQIPHHVTSLLTHLTSRPGVQSTFILSRKDGTIIQSTGLHAPKPTRTSPPPPSEEPSEPTSPAEAPSSPQNDQPPPPQQQQQQPQQPLQKPYYPSHAEALAAHIFAFVSSASDLSLSLSHPPEGAGRQEGFADGGAGEAEGAFEREGDDDEVKLLRLRTKKHEIVVVPDRKFLLCVVHDAAHGVAGGGSGGVSGGVRR
ncbi:hypothetical protein BO71DRAFT_447786 [Aspergillus ellipticus CBS 707.79]|uniref:Roadblock/LAMTOR2 domain-containing protein n=1 Tax=Aspergillus ellipticus CBS 707.79 TaxID=1448320 RepID=A0A319DK15_9EURO|nr:hypothetical protein BO71DRAFT_447786 [Aspergillus ellipticus CBS 707.79]